MVALKATASVSKPPSDGAEIVSWLPEIEAPTGSLSSDPDASSSSTVVVAPHAGPDRIVPATMVIVAGSVLLATRAAAVTLLSFVMRMQYETSAPGIATGLVVPRTGSLKTELTLVTKIFAWGSQKVMS